MQFERNPIQRFKDLFEIVSQNEIPESSATVLATATPDGQPSARVVLLKSCDDSGFVFYTNLASQKARELHDNPMAALCFYWPTLSVQVRAEGRTVLVSDAEADAYFASRPRGSQIGAWASKQSSVLASRSQLESAFEEYAKKYDGRDVPRPEFWSGFRLVPARIEFWQGRENRLHERHVYSRDGERWDVALLYP